MKEIKKQRPSQWLIGFIPCFFQFWSCSLLDLHTINVETCIKILQLRQFCSCLFLSATLLKFKGENRPLTTARTDETVQKHPEAAFKPDITECFNLKIRRLSSFPLSVAVCRGRGLECCIYTYELYLMTASSFGEGTRGGVYLTMSGILCYANETSFLIQRSLPRGNEGMNLRAGGQRIGKVQHRGVWACGDFRYSTSRSSTHQRMQFEKTSPVFIHDLMY